MPIGPWAKAPSVLSVFFIQRVSQIKIIEARLLFFGSILITFESSSIFGGSWGSIKNWLEPKTKPPFSKPKRFVLSTIINRIVKSEE